MKRFSRFLALIITFSLMMGDMPFVNIKADAKTKSVVSTQSASKKAKASKKSSKAKTANKAKVTKSVKTTKSVIAGAVKKGDETEQATSGDPVGSVEYTKIVVESTVARYVYGTNFDPNAMLVTYGYKEGATERETISNVFVKYSLKDGNSIYGTTGSVGVKTIVASYTTSSKTLTAELNVTIYPPNVTNFSESSSTDSSMTVTWAQASGITGYQLCYYSEQYGKWYYYGGPTSNKIAAGTTSYTIKSKTETSGDATYTPIDVSVCKDYEFYIRSFYIYGKDSSGKNLVLYSEKSPALTLRTGPYVTTGLKASDMSVSTINLSWNKNDYADGYVLYRRDGTDTTYNKIGTTTATTYTDGVGTALTSATTYRYKIVGYRVHQTYEGVQSSVIKTTTTPVKVVPKTKGGESMVRVSWDKCDRATGYNVYTKASGDADYYKAGSTLQGTYSFVFKNMKYGNDYKFKVTAYRTLDVGTASELTVYSEESKEVSGTPAEVPPTNTTAFNYLSLSDFKGSVAYETSGWFRKYINYKRSSIIPGASAANVGGFFSDRMCPQGMTFAGDYLLITAYDKNSEENSIIYVMEKGSGDYLTMIVLPDQIHAGGVAFDGENVWVCHGEKIACIKYSEIKQAAEEGDVYRKVDYVCLCDTKSTASYCTYYKNRLWIGTFGTGSQGKQPIYSYTVENKSGVPSISAVSSFQVPTRTQGMAFTTDGCLVLSRSYKSSNTKTSYICQLDYYKVTWDGDNITKTGSTKNSIPMPSMNESIAIKGAYIYVCYESPAFPDATIPMDRVCAFKKSGLLDTETR